ncbi:twin-arginine translocase subunit TatC [Pseudoclavibacter endophyticus]|uniref:Sec-independent protein translocase protein TatC n=1 Tax=Pseudoclavibacter endophyticus TaxID=1778590 RepID=A0A6H9WUM4_9MICO|nr:twin-arginine translocase subunit TatC [Pseudoclavibacter endophyticus]KAB1650194.1 twin-arginine translocase subunit TatC [Pseudoclavibacter endophyticus]
MPLMAHLVEFRNRFIISAIAVVLGMIGGFLLTEVVFDAIRVPITELAAVRTGGAVLNFSNVTTGFDIRLQMALTLGIVISSPVWLYQVWMFLMPGLKKRERRYALGFVGAAIPLFLAGCAVGWMLMPRIVEVMAGFAPSQDAIYLDAKYYYSFVLQLCLAVGIAFVMPVLLVLLNLAGVLEGRTILKGWRVAVLLVALFAALATPSADVLSMFLLMIPMIGLYFLAVGISLIVDRRRRKRQAAAEAEIESELSS